jgi:transposase
VNDLFLLSEKQMSRISPFFPLARVDDRRVVSGIVYVVRHGLQWKDAPKGYAPHKTLYNRFTRWSRMGVFDRIFASLAAEEPKAQRIMINSTHLKAYRSSRRRRPQSMSPEPGVYFTALGEAELRRGLAILPAGRRRTALDAWTVIAAGRPVSLIVAIARAHGARVATRNTGDYAGCGVALIDPCNRTKGQ